MDTQNGSPVTNSSCANAQVAGEDGCTVLTDESAVNPDSGTLITVSDEFDNADHLAPPAWQYLEQEAEAEVADVRGVVDDRRNHFWSRPETDALMFLQLLNLIDEQNSNPQSLSSNDQAALSLLLTSYNSYEVAVANEALKLYTQWSNSPCNFKPPVGDPYAYQDRELLYCTLSGFDYYTGLPAPPTADEFTGWANDVVSDQLRIQDIGSLGSSGSSANGYHWIAGASQHDEDLTLTKQYQDLVGSLQKGFQFLAAAENTASPLPQGQLTAPEDDLSAELTQASTDFGFDRMLDVAESSVGKLMNLDDILPDALEFLDTGAYVGSSIFGASAVAAVEAYSLFNQYSVLDTLQENVSQAADGGNLYALANSGTDGMEQLVNTFADQMIPTFDDRKYQDAMPFGPPPPPTPADPQFTVTDSNNNQVISPMILAQDWLPNTYEEYSVDSSNWVRRAQIIGNAFEEPDHGVPQSGESFDSPYSDTTIDYVSPSGDWWEAWPTSFGLMQVRDAQQVAPASSISIYPETTDGIDTGIPCSEAALGVGVIDPTYSGYECVVGTGTSFTSELQSGDFVQINGDVRQVASVYSDTAFDVTTPFSTLQGHPEVILASGPLMKLIGSDPNCWSDGNCINSDQFQYLGTFGHTYTALLGAPHPDLSTFITGPLIQYTPQQCNDSCINGQAWTFQNSDGPVSLEAEAYDSDPAVSITQVTWNVCAPNGSCTQTVTTGAPYLVSLPDGFDAGGEWTVSATALDSDSPPMESTETTDVDVLSAPQTITPPANGTAHAGDVTTITPTSSSGLPVVATSSTPLVCTTAGTNGSIVAFDAPGTCILALDQPGDSDYSPAQAQMQFTVTPPVAVLTSDDPLMGDGDSFGQSVAISGDIMAVGAPGVTPAVAPIGSEHQGAVYVLERPVGGSWSQAQVIAELTASDDATGNSNAALGSSVAINGNTIVAGAPGTYVNGNAEQGAVYVFSEPSGGWASETESAKLTASDGARYDSLGSSVGLFSNTVVAGAPDAEVNGELDEGAAYVFTEPGGGWSNETETAKLTDSDGTEFEQLGTSVGVSGGNIVAGVPGATVDGQSYQGAVYVFTQGSGWTDENQSAVLTASDGTSDAGLGTSVAIDGDTVVAGAPYADPGGTTGQGEAYAFSASGGIFTTGTETARLIATDGATNDSLGSSVALSGSSVAVGAPFAHIDAIAQGAAYTFDTSDWNETNKYSLPGDARSNALGESVAISSDSVVAGAPGATINGYGGAGAVATFELGTSVVSRNVYPPTISQACASPCISNAVTSTSDGEPLHVDNGAFVTQTPSTYRYQWQYYDPHTKVWTNVPGARGANYAVVASETGGQIRAIVTLTDSESNVVSATSDSVPVAPPTAPLIGTATIGCSGLQTCQPYFGAKLSASAIFTNSQGDWTVPDVRVSATRWMWCSDTVDLSTCTSASASSTFIPSSNPSGSPYLRVQVDAYYSDAAKATSNPEITATSAALPVLNGAAANAAPTLSCKKTGCSDLVGDTLVATAGTWSTHLRPITYTYQWERCFAQVDATHVDPASCYAIPNATKKQYTLGFDDVDYYVVADVTAVDSAGDTLTNVSNSTSMVNLPPAPTVKGTVKVTDLSRSSGNIQVGDSVQPSVTWVSPLPLVFTYQWVDCQSDGTNCAPVAGGSAGQVQTYTVARTDAGQQLAVQITATDPFSQTARTQSVSRRVQ